jgi:NitT/TauT family transport system substrate-binding protein
MGCFGVWGRNSVRAASAVVLGLAALALQPRPAAALEKVTYLLPAPASLPAFAPWVLAKHLGYYKDAGYDVQFVTARGGVDVAKQVGVGNAPIGVALGATPVIVRANGVPVKTVAVVGGGGLAIVVGRTDRGIQDFASLKGKTITTMSFQEAGYYAFLGTLASKGIQKSAVNVEAVGPAGVVGLVAAGKADGCICTPDWEVDVERAFPGKTVAMPLADSFPTMAQGIVASDTVIKTKPKLVRALVQATLKGMKYVMADPAKAAKAYIAALPAFKGKEDLMREILAKYAERTYGGQKVPGAMDPQKLAALQDAYLKQGVIQKKTPIDELYTNEFVK